jgi:GNAT superfamily N-acetyltransferase
VEVLVRDATAADALRLALVHVASWQQGYAGMLPGELLDSLSVDSRTARWRDILAADLPATTLVVESDGQVMGFATIGDSRDSDAPTGVGELWSIYVHPDRWGTGLGFALHGAALRALIDHGNQEATLWVLRQNERGRRFYERQGWFADGAHKVGHKGEVPLDEMRYRLHLPAPGTGG